jgi:hypothetical protein
LNLLPRIDWIRKIGRSSAVFENWKKKNQKDRSKLA